MNTTRSSAFCFLCVALVTVATIQTSSIARADGKLHALVIGNSEYRTGRLRNPANDAVALSAALEGLGFEVTKLTNVGQVEAEDAIFKFSRSIKDDGLAFFFFAGHGVQVKGENYLIPIDARIREEFEVRHQCISLSLILDALENSRSNMNVVVLDSCRDNPFQRSWSRAYRSGLAATSEVPEGTLIAYATSPGQTAADGNGQNSPYTLELVEALSKRPSSGLLLRDAFFEASRNVKKKTGQSPWINMEASLNKFYLTKPGAAAEQPPAPAVASVSLKPKASVRPPSSNTLPQPPGSGVPSSAPGSLHSTLLQQANTYLRAGDFNNAIEAFSAIIEDPNLSAEAKRNARKARGSAFLSRGQKTDFDRAIIDHKAAGLPGIRVPVRVSSSPLKVGTDIKGSVKRNQILLVTLSQGDWLWVQSINDDESLKGYIKKDALLEPKPVVSSTANAKSSQPVTSSRPVTSSGSISQGAITQGSRTQGPITQGAYPQGTITQGSYPQNNVVQGYLQGTQGQVYSQPQQQQRVYSQPQQNYSQRQSYSQPQQTYSRSQQTYSRQSTPSRGYGNSQSGRSSFRESFMNGYNRANSMLGRPSIPTPFSGPLMRRR